MRTIAIEEHFLADGFREVMKRDARSQGRGSNVAFVTEQQAKLADLGSTRLRDMDASGIDLQVISHTALGINSLPGGEGVRLAREANDQLAAAVAAHPDRFAGFATLPMLALQIIGADRIMFSVDYPYSSNEQGRVFLDSASISPADMEKISHLNVERLLKLAKG
jgi:predicted TIM-barrel fold metal-dependent hydrolase